GTFIGPFAGAGVVHLLDVRAVYGFAAALAVVTVVVVLAVPDVDRHVRPADAVSTWRVLAGHRQVFFTLGFAVLLVGAVRGSRQTVLPLWAEHLGLSPATTSIVFGISGAVDMLLFY